MSELFKVWVHLSSESCPVCGNDSECFTDNNDDMYTDSDEVRCANCHYPGWIVVADEGAYVAWAEEGYAPEAAIRIEELESKLKQLTELQRYSPTKGNGVIRMTPSVTGQVVVHHDMMEIIND